ncbi:11746_t:CDS:2 [Ambispora gerdemannii]|uniref:11746_t:CDS:1 n=1 Tax=Ambispora gerdemannii TaxID=144530 RepID=A0A9N8V2E6_9GLOM|nr:11746_t:CDS:2 [Ambispora gerdemannii]
MSQEPMSSFGILIKEIIVESPSPTSYSKSNNNNSKSKGKTKNLKRKKKLGILDSDLSSTEENEIFKEGIEDTDKAWDAFNSVLKGNDALTKTGKKKRKGKVSNNKMRGGHASD